MRSRKENIQFIKASNPTTSDTILNFLSDEKISKLAEINKQGLSDEIDEVASAY